MNHVRRWREGAVGLWRNRRARYTLLVYVALLLLFPWPLTTATTLVGTVSVVAFVYVFAVGGVLRFGGERRLWRVEVDVTVKPMWRGVRVTQEVG